MQFGMSGFFSPKTRLAGVKEIVTAYVQEQVLIDVLFEWF